MAARGCRSTTSKRDGRILSIFGGVAMRCNAVIGGALVLEAVRVDVFCGGVVADSGSSSSRTADHGASSIHVEFNSRSLAEENITVKMRAFEMTVVH